MNAANKQHDFEVQKSVREKHFAGAMLPDRYKEAGFKNYRRDHDGQIEAYNLATAYAREILKGEVKIWSWSEVPEQVKHIWHVQLQERF